MSYIEFGPLVVFFVKVEWPLLIYPAMRTRDGCLAGWPAAFLRAQHSRGRSSHIDNPAATTTTRCKHPTSVDKMAGFAGHYGSYL